MYARLTGNKKAAKLMVIPPQENRSAGRAFMLPTIAQIPAPDAVLLDLFSTSASHPSKCIKNAPYLCIPPSAGQDGKLYQLCCNDWLCPRCGELRAKHEYGRIVVGIRELSAQHEIYFLTLTCIGTESQEQAEAAYLERTHRFLAAFYYHVKHQSPPGHWAYVQVTERQSRGHPHSHLLIAAAPADVFYPVATIENYERYVRSIAAINAQIPPAMRFTATPRADLSLLDLHSQWLMLAAVKAGLGVQARISVVDSVEAASRYVAKYLFKSSMKTEMPKNWRRVRYSQGFPKLPESAPSAAFPLVHPADWQRAGALSGRLLCFSQETYERALLMRCYNVALHEKNGS